jgi:pyruvate/2-oxoglutarate dehydrogenase complex dihydrolipoamide acyltransferase (E2) component
VALSLLAVGTVDLVTSTAGGVVGPVSAAGLQAVAYRADAADLSDHRAQVRDVRAEADAAAARAAAQAVADAAAKAAAEAAAQAAAQAAASAAADAAAAAAAEAQRQAAAQQAARDAQRESLLDNARKDPRGAARAMLAEFGFADSQFSCLNSLWTRESNWLYSATNPSSGAYGIPQSLPASQMASAGADYRTNPVTQIRWGLGYIQQRYGTPCGAWAHSQSTGWY